MIEHRIKAIDGWRTCSIFLVIVSHLAYRSDFASSLPWYKVGIYPYGALGVSIFFFISGFVIAGGLLREHNARAVSVRAFYVRRLFRIVPPLFVFLVTVAGLKATEVLSLPWTDILYAGSFTCNLTECDQAVGHTWSLAFEEQFYLLFPFIFVRSEGRPGVIALIAIIMLLITLIISTVLSWNAIERLSSVNGLALGVTAAMFLKPISERLRLIPAITVPLGVAALFAFASIQQKFPIWIGAEASVATHLLIEQPLIAFVVLGSIFVRSSLSEILEWAPFQTLGKASYGIYLWQQLTTGPLGHLNIWTYLILNVGMLAACVVLFRHMDSFFIRQGRKMSAWLSGVGTNEAI